MSKLTRKQTIEKYPELFGTDFSLQKTLMAFGFEVGDGWFEIIKKYLPKMSKIVKEEGRRDFRIVQVKEKFGGLCIYCNYYTDAIDDIIEEMEEECAETCEKCGKPGIFRADGWMRVSCDKCEAKKPKS